MNGNGGAVCVIGQKIKEASELDLEINENVEELKSLINAMNSLIGGGE